MKIAKKLTALAVSSLMMFSVAGITASAATVTQDGLNVSLTTDKTEYKKDEAITATLTVENTGGASVKDVKLENVVPEGYELAKDYSLTKSVDELKSNDKAELKVVYNAKTGGNVTPSNNNTTPANTTTTASSANVSTDTVQTGDTAVAVVIIAVIVVSLGLGFLAVRKKKGRSLLSIALTVSILGTAIAVVSVETNAAGTSKTIEVTEKIKADNTDKELKAKVTFETEEGKTSEPDISQPEISEPETSSNEVEEYYKKNAEIIDVFDVTPKETLSESEVTKLLNQKGFTDYPLIYNYSLSGDYNNDQEGDPSSEVKHPMYGTYYASNTGELWYITVVGKELYATPLSYNISENMSVQTIISSSDWIMGYDDEEDRFFKVIMKNTALIVKVVDKIDAETLDKLTTEEVGKL